MTAADPFTAHLEELARRYMLTAREQDVLALLARGNCTRAIAQKLGLTFSTVQSYQKSVYAKLGINKKQQAVDLFAHLYEGQAQSQPDSMQ
jgi:DNA-binding NarL/FixJ family response regulator